MHRLLDLLLDLVATVEVARSAFLPSTLLATRRPSVTCCPFTLLPPSHDTAPSPSSFHHTHLQHFFTSDVVSWVGRMFGLQHDRYRMEWRVERTCSPSPKGYHAAEETVDTRNGEKSHKIAKESCLSNVQSKRTDIFNECVKGMISYVYGWLIPASPFMAVAVYFRGTSVKK